jgi:hypothetical protein
MRPRRSGALTGASRVRSSHRPPEIRPCYPAWAVVLHWADERAGIRRGIYGEIVDAGFTIISPVREAKQGLRAKMVNPEDVKLHLELLEERHREFKSAVEELANSLSGNDIEHKCKRATSVRNAGLRIQDIVPTAKRPEWLNELTRTAGEFSAHKAGGGSDRAMLSSLVQYWEKSKTHRWKFDEKGEGVNFEAIYQEALKESELTSIFDDVIQILQDLLPKLDTLSAIQTLQELIETFRVNRQGSYFAVTGAWAFMGKVWETGFWEALKQHDSTRSLVQRLEGAVEHGGAAFKKLQEGVTRRTTEVFAMHAAHLSADAARCRPFARLERSLQEDPVVVK